MKQNLLAAQRNLVEGAGQGKLIKLKTLIPNVMDGKFAADDDEAILYDEAKALEEAIGVVRISNFLGRKADKLAGCTYSYMGADLAFRLHNVNKVLKNELHHAGMKYNVKQLIQELNKTSR